MSSKTNSNSPETHQSKADLQRIYREKEADGFAELQDVIRQVTDGRIDPAKRHETLTKAAQKIRELSLQNEQLREQLNRISNPQGGQAWPGGAGPGFGAPGNNFNTMQYPQYYPNNAAPSNTNFGRGYPGQGRGV